MCTCVDLSRLASSLGHGAILHLGRNVFYLSSLFSHQIDYGIKTAPPKLGFVVEMDVPVKSDVQEDGSRKTGTSLQVEGRLDFSETAEISGTLYMKDTWKKAFGLSFINIANVEIG